MILAKFGNHRGDRPLGFEIAQAPSPSLSANAEIYLQQQNEGLRMLCCAIGCDGFENESNGKGLLTWVRSLPYQNIGRTIRKVLSFVGQTRRSYLLLFGELELVMH